MSITMEKKPKNTTLVLVRIDTLTPPCTPSPATSPVRPARSLAVAAGHNRSNAASESLPPSLLRHPLHPSHSHHTHPRLSRMHSAPVMNSQSGKKLKGLVRRWTSTEPDTLEDEEESLRVLAESTVPIKPDYPDDDKPPYTKEEALEIKTGKQAVRPGRTARLIDRLKRNTSTLDPLNEIKDREAQDALVRPTESDEYLLPSPPTTKDELQCDRPASRESAAVTSESDEEESEASPRNSQQGLLERQDTAVEHTNKHARRPSALATLLRRASFFHRPSSFRAAIATPPPSRPHEDGINPKSQPPLPIIAGPRDSQLPSNPNSSSTTSTTCDARQNHHHHHHHHHHHLSSSSIVTPMTPSSRLAFLNPFTSLEHSRRAREDIASADEWFASLAKKTPLLFTNNADIVAYLDLPGPSDKLARLIEGRGFSDWADEGERAAARKGLEAFFNLWVDGALLDWCRYRGWRVEMDWGFLVAQEGEGVGVKEKGREKEAEKGKKVGEGKNAGEGDERKDSAELKRVFGRVGGVFLRKKSGLAASSAEAVKTAAGREGIVHG